MCEQKGEGGGCTARLGGCNPADKNSYQMSPDPRSTGEEATRNQSQRPRVASRPPRGGEIRRGISALGNTWRYVYPLTAQNEGIFYAETMCPR